MWTIRTRCVGKPREGVLVSIPAPLRFRARNSASPWSDVGLPVPPSDGEMRGRMMALGTLAALGKASVLPAKAETPNDSERRFAGFRIPHRDAR